VISDYLAWGRTQGGRGGRPWDGQNAALKEGYLDWWVNELNLDVFGDIQLAGVEKAIRDLLDSGDYAPKSVALRVEALNSFCLWAERRGYVPRNPLVGLAKVDSRPREPHRALTEDEAVRLLNAAPAHRQLWYETAMATGYRVSELRALRVRDLDMKGPSLPLGADFTKNRKDARQPVTRQLAERLLVLTQGAPGDAPLLGIPSSKAWKGFKADLKAAKIPVETPEGKASWHSLRKYFVNALIRSGADVKTLMELARHSSASLTMEVYASAEPKRLRDAVEAAALHITRAKNGSPCCTDGANKDSPQKPSDVNHVETGSCSERKMVGATGFEPATPCSQSRCATGLRHAPTERREFSIAATLAQRAESFNLHALACGSDSTYGCFWYSTSHSITSAMDNKRVIRHSMSHPERVTVPRVSRRILRSLGPRTGQGGLQCDSVLCI